MCVVRRRSYGLIANHIKTTGGGVSKYLNYVYHLPTPPPNIFYKTDTGA
jgi:hypothetical protein